MQTASQWCAQVCAWTCKTPLKSVGATARRRAGATARRHHPNPAEADRRWRGERSKPVRLGVRDHHTRSLCAQSPAQSEQWYCWFGRRRSIVGSAEIAGQFVPTAMPLDGQRRRRTLAEDPEQYFPSGAAQTRIVSAARIRLDPRKSVRSYKGIIYGDISEIAVGTLITERPPHRTERAPFGHSAPTSGI